MPEVVNCERCQAHCRVDTLRSSNAKMLRRSKEPKGLCVNCAVHDWLRNTYPPNILLAQSGPKILFYPHIQKQFVEIMKIGFADAEPEEIDWNRIIENWELSFPKKIKPSGINPCNQQELDEITAGKRQGLGRRIPSKPDPLGDKMTITSFEELNELDPGDKMADKKTGTREWAKTNVNIQLGCEHGCRYCYARYLAIKRFKWCTAGRWLDPVIIKSRLTGSFSKRPGVVMFPSTHDVTTRNLSECICVLRKLLDAGNNVLLVSKPHFECITAICESFLKYRKQLSFRFTIGSINDRILAFWEPNAPCFEERLECLKHAYYSKYQTSVSCEPFLDFYIGRIIGLYEMVKPYITNSFWIGKLREFDRRVDLSGVTSEQEERFIEPLKAAQSDEMIWAIYELLHNERLIRWKDSIREVIEKCQY